MTKVLRPVPTFDQLVNLPIPQLTPPERAIEVSRPDPNVFDFHKGQMGQQQNLMHMHAMHEMMMRQQAQAQGADINVMRDLTDTAQQRIGRCRTLPAASSQARRDPLALEVRRAIAGRKAGPATEDQPVLSYE